MASQLVAAGKGDFLDRVLPEAWPDEPYVVPAVTPGEFRFHAMRIDAAQLVAELERLHAYSLWPQFATHFGEDKGEHRPPLREMGRWRLALALAAGLAQGVLTSRSGRILLAKGDTYKDKIRSVELSENADGTMSETVILTDRFVLVIRAIDFTPGPGLGTIVTIQ